MFPSRNPTDAQGDWELIPILTAGSEGRWRRETWSTAYWLLLKVLCLFHGRNVVPARQCHACRLQTLERKREAAGNTGPLPNYLFHAAISSPAGWGHTGDEDVHEDGIRRDENVNEIPEDERYDTCAVCTSMWWNADGKPNKYKEVNIGVYRWNHWGSFCLSIFLLLVCIGFLLYDGMTYLILYWGNQKQTLRLLSYSTYLGNISTIPLLCLVANLRHIFPRSHVHNFAWSTALHPQFIVKRLQYLRPESTTVNRLLLFVGVLWSLCVSIYRACIYIFLADHHQGYGTHDYITIITDGIQTVIWVLFCYLLSVLRRSIRKQLQLDVKFLLEHVGKVDICRRRLGASLDEFGSVSNLCAIWMIITVSLTSLGLACHTTWNYMLYSMQIKMTDIELHINIMIWLELFLFLVLPLMVVGGLDLRHIWGKFLLQICQVRTDANNQFWEKIVKFITLEFAPMTNVVQWTLLFSVISFYMALQVGDQSAGYWNDHINITTTAILIIGPPARWH